ncbi:hypothetical protein CMK11_02515 [Candidatus Poribacteria bacterium]|nr:hypothetical protein [Candidatus Poribacteria bacterium]
MPIFHWCVVGFFALMLLLLAASSRRRRAATEDDEAEQMQECSLCGREDRTEAFVERQFMSGYHHHLCGSCVAELHGEAGSRDILPQDVEELPEQ